VDQWGLVGQWVLPGQWVLAGLEDLGALMAPQDPEAPAFLHSGQPDESFDHTE
jgi:hypothetical protein